MIGIGIGGEVEAVMMKVLFVLGALLLSPHVTTDQILSKENVFDPLCSKQYTDEQLGTLEEQDVLTRSYKKHAVVRTQCREWITEDNGGTIRNLWLPLHKQ